MHGEGIAYLPTVWLASCRIRLNCFFILYLSALTPTGGNIPHYFSQYNGPCSAAAQHKIPTVAFPFPHRKLPAPIQNLFHDRTKLILLLMINVFPPPPSTIYVRPIACAGMLDQFTAGTRTQGATAATRSLAAAQQCNLGNVVSGGRRSRKESTLGSSCLSYSIS